MKRSFANSSSPLSNSSGFLSADFLFSMVIATGLCALFFCLSFTLSMVEVGQYMAFSITRAHMSGHKTQPDQERMATLKFASFKKNPVLKPLLENGWFEITNLVIAGGGQGGKDFGDRYPRGAGGYSTVPQTGIRLDFEAKILKGNITRLGSTDSSGEYKAYLTGLMIREPSAEECFKQIRDERYDAIQKLDSRFEQISGASSSTSYVPMEDNGC